MRRRTPPDLAPRGRARSAPPTPAARTPASCAATGASGERQPGFRQGTCASRCARGAAHRGSRRIAPAATRHARGRSARRPPPSLAADHAAALWQLWWRVGRTTTITCQVVESHALYHRLQRATGAGRGANAGTAQRAGDGGSTYPANQHRVCIHTLSCVRRLTMLVPIGTAFGYGTRTHTLSRTLRSPSIGRAEARATDATRGDSRALLDESTARAGRVDRSWRSSGPVQRGEWTSREWRVGEFQGATRRYTPLARSSGRTGGPLAHPTRPSPFGEAPSAGVDSPPRVGPRRGRVDRSPLPCAPPLPLRALPTHDGVHNCIISSFRPKFGFGTS